MRCPRANVISSEGCRQNLEMCKTYRVAIAFGIPLLVLALLGSIVWREHYSGWTTEKVERAVARDIPRGKPRSSTG